MRLDLDRRSWRRVAFGDVIESVTDRNDDPSQAGVKRYVGLEHLDPGVLTVQRWDSPDTVSAQKLRFQSGDVIFGRRRAYQKKVAMAEFEGICSAHALVLRANPDAMNAGFLPHFIASDYFLDRAISISVGSLSPTVNWRDLKVQVFELPPIDEQNRIADLLWTVEKHRNTLAAQVVEVAEAHSAWVTDRLSDFPTVSLGEVVQLQHGRPVPSALYGQGDFPLLRPGDMHPSGTTSWSPTSVRIPYSFADDKSDVVLKEGDLVINMTAQSLEDAFLGRVCRMHDRALLNQRIGRLEPRSVDPEYLFVALRAPRFTAWVARRCEGSKVKHMHWRHIENYPFPLPEQDQQHLVVAEHNAWSAVLSTAESERVAVESLRSAISRDVFGGNK